MMNKLFHAPLACSLAARFAAAEGDVPLDIVYLSLKTKKLEDGGNFLDIDSLGQVSTLHLESGELITEPSAVILWIQSQSSNPNFRRDPRDLDYFQMIRWLRFCAIELHKQLFRVVFYLEATDEFKSQYRVLAPKGFEILNHHLSDKTFLLGENYSAADAYLTWFFVLSEEANVDPTVYEYLNAYRERVLARPLIRELIESDRHKSDEVLDLHIL